MITSCLTNTVFYVSHFLSCRNICDIYRLDHFAHGRIKLLGGYGAKIRCLAPITVTHCSSCALCTLFVFFSTLKYYLVPSLWSGKLIKPKLIQEYTNMSAQYRNIKVIKLDFHTRTLYKRTLRPLLCQLILWFSGAYSQTIVQLNQHKIVNTQ